MTITKELDLVVNDTRTIHVSVNIELGQEDNGIGSYECHGYKGFDSRICWVPTNWLFKYDGEPELKDELETLVDVWVENNVESLGNEAGELANASEIDYDRAVDDGWNG